MRWPSFCFDVRFGLSKLTSQLGKDEIACVFLLACNFTDALLPSLNSLRFAGKGLTEIGFFLEGATVHGALRRYVRLGPWKPPKGGFCV